MATLNVQVVTDVMVNPPQPGDPSFSQFEEVRLGVSGFGTKSAVVFFCQLHVANSALSAANLYKFPSAFWHRVMWTCSIL